MVKSVPVGSVSGVFDGVVGDGVAAVVGCCPIKCDCLVAAVCGEVCWGVWCCRWCCCGVCGGRCSVSFDVGGGDSEVVGGPVGEPVDGCRC